MSVLSKLKAKRKTQAVTFKGIDITLTEPTVTMRNQYLLKVEQVNKKGDFTGDSKEDVTIDFNLLSQNHECALHLVAMCMAPSEGLSVEAAIAALLEGDVDGLIDELYPHAEALTWPKAPTDAVDPKADQASDSHTA